MAETDGPAAETEVVVGPDREPLRSVAWPRNLLVVEDSPEYALLVKEMLRSERGVESSVVVVDTLAAAQDELRRGTVDCVLLDLTLPDADGLEALGVVRETAPEAPVVVLSGHGGEALAVRAVQAGAQDYLVKGHANGHLLVRAIRFAVERQRVELDLAHRAVHDPLTGLPNRVLLLDRLQQALARVERGSSRVAVMFVDLDGFKLINDRFGHDAGDAMLVEVGKRLSSLLRASDTVARLGGDEFVMVCEQIASDSEAADIATRIRVELARPFVAENRELRVDASVGIAFAPDRSIDPEAMIRAADRAMYRAKDRGVTFEIAGAKRSVRLSSRRDIEAELRRAIVRDEFSVYYQPQVDVYTRKLIGVEALVRWDHPERGLLDAAKFVSVAEHSGLIAPIGAIVIERALSDLSAWRTRGICDDRLVMSINLSPRELAEPGLVTGIERRLRRFGVAARGICFEITESTIAADPQHSASALPALKALGVRLALDDFGVGQSTLGALGDYPLDSVKIDRSFVAPLANGLKGRRVFAAVLGLAHALELVAVAEGIETSEQMTHIAQAGCDVAQGFRLGRPVGESSVTPLLLSASS